MAQNNADAKKEIARIALPHEKLPMALKSYGFAIRVHNMGGYNAGYWLNYKLGQQTLGQELHLNLGEGHEFQIPAGATDISLVAYSYTGLVWAPWKEIYHHKMGRSMIDHCYTNWGTTLGPGHGAC